MITEASDLTSVGNIILISIFWEANGECFEALSHGTGHRFESWMSQPAAKILNPAVNVCFFEIWKNKGFHMLITRQDGSLIPKGLWPQGNLKPFYCHTVKNNYHINPNKHPCSNKRLLFLFRKCYINLYELLFASLNEVGLWYGSTFKGKNLILQEQLLSFKADPH